MARFIAVAFLAVLLISAVAAQEAQCLSYFRGLGGRDGISQRVPSCSQGIMGFSSCCAEVKALVNAGPSGCLCIQSVWQELVRQIESIGINGLNEQALNTFARMCGITHYGDSTC